MQMWNKRKIKELSSNISINIKQSNFNYMQVVNTAAIAVITECDEFGFLTEDRLF